MPFYEYKCTICEYKFEEFQEIKEERLKECPKCGKEVKRLISHTVGQIIKNSQEAIKDIKEEAKKDARAIENGDVEKACDYLGEERALKYYDTK